MNSGGDSRGRVCGCGCWGLKYVVHVAACFCLMANHLGFGQCKDIYKIYFFFKSKQNL